MQKGKKQKYISILKLLIEINTKKIKSDEIFDVAREMRESIRLLYDDIEEQTSLLKIRHKLGYALQLMDCLQIDTWNKTELNDVLVEVLNAVEIEMKDVTKQVVFMPYNASMWDTFDSIYREVEKEDNVEALVMPIPYWGIDENKLFTICYYEKDLLPQGLNLIDYRDVELCELDADVIFIHNPYDQYNTLTRVFPEFFSSNLKKYTNRLVYIPYYLSDIKTSSDQAYMPGVRNSWRTYVQSEEIKKQMLAAGNEKSKIRVVGSPKIDDIIRKSVNKPEPPEEWSNQLKGKTIFCFITTIVSVLNKPDLFLDKVQWVRDYFAQKDNIAVIWRPHPHTEKLLKGKNLQRYQLLRNQFKLLKNGVLDEGMDNHFAFQLSDAYIGERSSMLTLYKVTGKPVYVMDWRRHELEKGDRSVCIGAVNIIGNKMWGFESRYNAIFEVNVQNNNALYVQSVEDEPWYGELLFRDMVCYEDKVLLISASAKNDILIDFHTNKQSKLQSYRKDNEHGVKNVNVIQQGSKVYMLPYFEESIVEYDFKRNTLCEIFIDYAAIRAKIGREQIFTWSFGQKTKDGFWLGSKFLNAVFFINNNGSAKLYEMGLIKNGITDGFLVEDNLYLLPIGGEEIIRFNTKTCKEEKLSILDRILLDKSMNFVKMAKHESKWIFTQPGSIILFDESDGSQSIWLTNSILFLNILVWDNVVYLFSPNVEYYGKIYLDETIFELKKIILCEREQQIMHNRFYKKKREIGKEDYFYSENISSIDTYINSVIHDQENQVEVVRPPIKDKLLGYVDGSCGKRIWEDIKNEMDE